MSEPARNASVLLAEALKPGASLDQITLALEAILAVTAKGLGGDASAYAQYQALLLELHVGGDPHTEPTRRWMASQVYLVEDRFAPEPAGFSAVPVEEFRKKVDAEIEARSRVRHPMSVHLFQGTPPVEDVRFFLEHHWVRSYNLQPPGGLAFRFENIEDASVFYRNLYGEAGAETPERSHPALLSHLMTYFDIPLRIDFPALHPLEKAYLNNRIRCVRHTDVAWGLALLYAVESVSCVNHRRIYELLQRLGVPEQPSEFHRLHGTQDEIDTEEMWALIAKFAPSETSSASSCSRWRATSKSTGPTSTCSGSRCRRIPGHGLMPIQNKNKEYRMNTRNFSLPQLQNLPIDEARIVADALAVHATSRQIDSAASKLAALAEAGLKGDRQAYAAYQQLLYVLSLSDDVATAQTRRWLARAIYRVEERFMPAADLSRALSEEDFQKRLEQEIAA